MVELLASPAVVVFAGVVLFVESRSVRSWGLGCLGAGEGAGAGLEAWEGAAVSDALLGAGDGAGLGEGCAS